VGPSVSTPPVQRAITEAIESIASTEARVSILVRALGRAGLPRVPERGPEVLRFVEGPLLDAIVERLGTAAADQIVEHLRPLLRLAARGPASRPPPRAAETARPPPGTSPPGAREPRPTMRVTDPAQFAHAATHDPSVFERQTLHDPMQLAVTPVPPASSRAGSATPGSEVSGARPRPRPTVPETMPPAASYVLASLDDQLIDAVEALEGLSIRTVRGLFELVDAAEDARDRSTTLVFDCAAPPVHIASLLALAADMPVTVRVALLGASQLDRQALASAPERTVGWAFLERPTAGELAQRIQAAASASRSSAV